ncbi:hypothetical protein FRB99_000709, partial [Tulasnella sp. 403]
MSPALSKFPSADILPLFDHLRNHIDTVKTTASGQTHNFSIKEDDKPARLVPPSSSPEALATAGNPTPRSSAASSLHRTPNAALDSQVRRADSAPSQLSAAAQQRVSVSICCGGCKSLQQIQLSWSLGPDGRPSVSVLDVPESLEFLLDDSLDDSHRGFKPASPRLQQRIAPETNNKTIQSSSITRTNERLNWKTNATRSPEPLKAVTPSVPTSLEPHSDVKKKPIVLSDWIPSNLQSKTRKALELVMKEDISKSDKPGYIYCFQFLDENWQKDVIWLKVGRTKDLNRRIRDWQKSCGKERVRPLGYYPGGDAGNVCLSPGRIRAGRKVKNTHKLERLIHLELADLAEYRPYLGDGTHRRPLVRQPCTGYYLQRDTKAVLRVEMERPLSESEEDGYIYCFNLRDPKQPDVVHLKVGRTTNVAKRIDEWTKSCGSKEPIPRGFYPGGDDNSASLLLGRIVTGTTVKNTHRLERLILLELADLATYKPYLSNDDSNEELKQVKQEDGEVPLEAEASQTPQSKPKDTEQQVRYPCDDCGVVHKEVFSFNHPKGREWEEL